MRELESLQWIDTQTTLLHLSMLPRDAYHRERAILKHGDERERDSLLDRKQIRVLLSE